MSGVDGHSSNRDLPSQTGFGPLEIVPGVHQWGTEPLQYCVCAAWFRNLVVSILFQNQQRLWFYTWFQCYVCTNVNCPNLLKGTNEPFDWMAKNHQVLLSQIDWMWGAEMGANECGVVIGHLARTKILGRCCLLSLGNDILGIQSPSENGNKMHG